MAQEENVFGCSYSGGNGGGRGSGGGSCRSKKIKPKKVPQRGLGVAQLEKIRIEEEQKNVSASSPSDGGGANSFLGVQKFRPNISPFHNSPPPSSSSNLSSPNALFRHSQSAPNIEILQESCSVSRHNSNGEIGSRPILWGGGDYNHHPFAFDLPYEPSATPILPQRSHHFQPPPSSMVQVNTSCGISPSSVLTSHLEPPSNQSSLPSNYAPQWTEEEKMVGMKRSYPFSLESPPPPSLHSNFFPSSAPQPDLALCSSGYTPRNKCIRGSPLLERRPSDVAGDDESLHRDFLTLAPPSSNLKHTHPSQPESSGSVKESFDFFPVKLFANQRSNGVRNGNCEEGDHAVDLNLKL